MVSIRTTKIKVNIKHQEKQSEFVQQISGAIVIMNLFWLNFIKFFPELDHSCLVMEDGTCLSTPHYA